MQQVQQAKGGPVLPGQADSVFTHVEHGPNVMASINKFALNLYKQLIQGSSDNIFMSPASITLALGMTYLGARNATAQQMKSTLQIEVPEDVHFHQAMEDLINMYKDPNVNYSLNIANRLFGQNSFKFLDVFLSETNQRYRAALQAADFANNHSAEILAINEWVGQETKGKIPELLGQDDLNPLTRLVLVNAIYFKGNWSNKFDVKNTQQRPFYINDNDTVQVDMMFQEKKMPFGYNKDLDTFALELPYIGDHLSMLILLPKSRTGLATLESNLTADHLSDPRKQFQMIDRMDVRISLPKFKLDSSFQLANTLAAMGMPDLFDESKADLSGVEASKMLFVSKVIHQAVVEVNEEGTEAAAATAVVMGYRSMPMKQEFNANHPFLFCIRDTRAGIPLFLGRLLKPSTTN